MHQVPLSLQFSIKGQWKPYDRCEARAVQQGQCNNDSQVNKQEWILPELSDKVECLVHDRQADQEQGIQAQGWVACLQPTH